jgi:myo-inositol-1-phosphate synthase
VIKGSRQQQVEVVRQQIRQFKQDNAVDKVIILWTANTERYAQVRRACMALVRMQLQCVARWSCAGGCSTQ